jgi:transposase
VSKVNRNAPKRSRASDSTYSLMEFMQDFPDDAACLDWLWRNRFSYDGSHAHCPKCKRTRKFHRVASRPSYSCDSCGKHVHPTAGTIMHRSSTSLHLWFYAMYLMTSTRCAVSAKHLGRELGVGYKTAWRMANLIRNVLMDQDQDDDEKLSGEVEADETWIGGKPKASDRARARAKLAHYPDAYQRRGQLARLSERPKSIVFGAVERGGRVRATVIPDSQGPTLGRQLHRFVVPDARLITDDWRGYTTVARSYAKHDTINHSNQVYVSGDVHTNTIEGFFGNLKTGIAGNYHSVSPKWLQGYLNEFAWRYNHRKDDLPMFQTLAFRVADTAL